MSETEATMEDGDDGSAEASTEATTTSIQEGSSGGSSLEDFVSAAEQEIIKEWVGFVTGLFAAIGIGIGLNSIIQDQWGHALMKTSVMGQSAGTPFSPFSGLGLAMNIGILLVVLLGVVFAWNIDNEEYTAIKVAAATSLVAIPVFSLVTGFLVLVPADNTSLEVVNVIVSGLGSGIAATVGASIVIFLTDSQAPDGLSN
ncbi:hypothetical protein L593_13480 [Salinarchaeum sp. Harcht-Bsk1]|uniref:hypothetical protein n=1 Tax=Salinarchaeum sp. Harcht-Bsk1 TaxID=1333523 RepID=UPI0003423097|nr:hypothetical protein [Salinarchaeum sp. Harcht-Bsk1]AGN02635.1 hypothetical protein L593_13480 [Salinarchaeum sp. Harcht-Bsk1]